MVSPSPDLGRLVYLAELANLRRELLDSDLLTYHLARPYRHLSAKDRVEQTLRRLSLHDEPRVRVNIKSTCKTKT